MGQKDKSEKYLEAFNDVFADILNVLLFQDDVIDPDELKDSSVETIYKAEEGNLRSQSRDILKEYRNSHIVLAAFGIENQSGIDKDMPIRIMGYDYAAYRQQIDNGTARYPVISIVLNFSDTEWKSPLSLKETLEIPEHLEPFVQDYRIFVFNIAFLSKEVRSRFKSDFKAVADFFSEKRTGHYQPGMEEIKHVEAVLDLLRVFTNDNVYEEIKEAVLRKQRKGEVITMCTFAQEMKQEGREEARDEGIRNIIDAYLEFNLNDDEIAKRVSEKYDIPADTIKEKYLKDK